jgi:hypothetical protein
MTVDHLSFNHSSCSSIFFWNTQMLVELTEDVVENWKGKTNLKKQVPCSDPIAHETLA